MNEIISIITTLVLLVFVMVIFTRENLDYAAISLFIALISCFITGSIFNISFPEFLGFIEFEAIIFIISMQVIVTVTEEFKIFQWIALKVLHLVKGRHRLFFYVICTVSCFTAALISDITIAIIFIPLVIRATRILKVNTAPYLYGISFTINIGSIYTPFSSAENILISSFFELDYIWFITRFTLFCIPALLLTLFLIDMVFLRKMEPPNPLQKQILLEIMEPRIVIADKRKFILNFIYFILVIIGFLVVDQTYVVAMIGALAIMILNGKEFAKYLRKVDWKLITFLIALFLLVGNMQINGTFNILSFIAEKILADNMLIASITVLLLISVFSGFLAQVPTALVFIALLEKIYLPIYGAVPGIVLMGFILGINIGSNFLPQGAACDLIALNLAKKNKIKGFNYRSLLKYGSMITLVHIFNSIVYLTLYALVTGVIG